MHLILAALLPVFVLMLLGYALRRCLLPDGSFWLGLEQLVYFVLFPALLIDTLSRANLASVSIAGVGGALLLSVLLMGALCLALRPVLARRFGVAGPAFSSLFQGSTRWQTYVAISVVQSLFGDPGLAIAAVAMVAMIPVLNVMAVSVLARYAAPQRLAWPALLAALARNPFIISCAVGVALNLLGLPLYGIAHDIAEALARCSLAIGLLVVGAGLQFGTIHRAGVATWLAVGLKLVLMPLMAMGLASAFGVTGTSFAVVACCAAVPSAANGYVLARQMGGDAPLLAQILVLQTLVAALTMPLMIALASN
jgi:predicted permease